VHCIDWSIQWLRFKGVNGPPTFLVLLVKVGGQHRKSFSLAPLANILDPPLFITYLSPWVYTLGCDEMDATAEIRHF
jgi:hypothetical protein